MAEAFRSVMEVLKWTEPCTLLKGTALVSPLWAAISESDELWREQIDALEGSLTEAGKSPAKLHYKEVALCWSKDVTIHFIDQKFRVYSYRKQQVVKEFAVPDDWIEERSAAALLTHKFLFVCGGDTRRERAAVISLVDGSASAEPNMRDGRSYHCALAISHLIYVFGGFPGPCSCTADVFNSQSHAWRKLPNMCTSHSSFTACLKEKLVYICGGHCDECETFDTVTEKFEQLQWTLEERNWTVSFVYKNDVVAIIGSNFYVLRNDRWEMKTGQNTLIP